MPTKQALEIARDAEMDLVEISPSANPPVVKVISWGKYQYQRMKELSKNRKNTKSGELKQMRLGLKIEMNDLNIKIKKIKKFLEGGQRVKVIIVFKGRELAHKELGTELMNKIIDMLSDCAVVDQQPQFAGRNLSIGIRRK